MTSTCKYCGAPISETAFVCEYCGSKNRDGALLEAEIQKRIQLALLKAKLEQTRNTPYPPPPYPPSALTKEEFEKKTLEERWRLSVKHPEQYKALHDKEMEGYSLNETKVIDWQSVVAWVCLAASYIIPTVHILFELFSH